MDKSAKFQVSGTIVEIGEEQTFSIGFTKRDVIVETSRNDAYPSPVKLTFKKDDCTLADGLHTGDGVSAEGFVEGRKWEGPKGTSYFTDLVCKSVMIKEKAETSSASDLAPVSQRPTAATDWKSLLALGAAWGEGEDKVKARGKAYGKPFAQMGAADWQKIADEIRRDNGGATVEEVLDAGADADDMPF